jgi:sulfur carrier protein
MQVTVNGRDVELPDGTTVAVLVERMALDGARVAIERNQDVVPRKTWRDCALAPGDQVEIVTFVGGG